MARLLNRNPTAHRLTIGDRGAMRPPPQAAGMTYHHIIPFNGLRDFWNAGVACDLEPLRETLVPALLRAVDDYPLDQGNPTRARLLVASARRMLQMIWMGNYAHSPTADSPDGVAANTDVTAYDPSRW